jgi:hypothetical protein
VERRSAKALPVKSGKGKNRELKNNNGAGQAMQCLHSAVIFSMYCSAAVYVVLEIIASLAASSNVTSGL